MSLRKEMAVAIFLGLLFGGGVAFALRQLPNKLQDTKSTLGAVTTVPEQSPTPTPLLEESLSLEILLPEQQALISDDSVTVSGKTTPQALVAITSAAGEAVVVAGADGTFSGKIDLVEGANELFIVSSIHDNDATKTVVVNYISEEQ